MELGGRDQALGQLLLVAGSVGSKAEHGPLMCALGSAKARLKPTSTGRRGWKDCPWPARAASRAPWGDPVWFSPLVGLTAISWHGLNRGVAWSQSWAGAWLGVSPGWGRGLESQLVGGQMVFWPSLLDPAFARPLLSCLESCRSPDFSLFSCVMDS